MLADDDFTNVPDDQTRLPVLAGLALVCAELEDTERARILYELLLPHAHHTAVTSDALVCSGSLSRHLGLLATVLERWDDAARHFEDALTMNERMRSPPLVATTQVDYAKMLIVKGDPANRDRSAGFLSKAELTAQDLGMAALLRRIDSLRSGMTR
jgi:hypothetical protein